MRIAPSPIAANSKPAIKSLGSRILGMLCSFAGKTVDPAAPGMMAAIINGQMRFGHGELGGDLASTRPKSNTAAPPDNTLDRTRFTARKTAEGLGSQDFAKP